MTLSSQRALAREIGAAVLVLLGVASAYVTTLDGTFVWDDRELILRSPSVEHLTSLAGYLLRPFWQESNVTHETAFYYRPLVIFSYALDYHAHGPNPSGFHLTNVLWHLVVTGLVIVAARRTASMAAASVCAAIFGLLPRLCECVAWIAGRTDPMACAFALGALLVWTSRWPGRKVLALLLLSCGLSCKEVALAGVLGVAVYELREADGRRAAIRRAGPNLLLLAGLSLAYLLVLRRVLGTGPVLRESALGLAERGRIALAATGTYAWLVLNPFQPRTRIGLVTDLSPGAIALGVTSIVVAVVGLARWGRRASSLALALLAMAAAALFPVLHLVPFPYRVLASDRFLYVPMAAGLAAAAPLVARALGRWPVAAGAAAAALVLSLGIRTVERCQDWNDEVRFWADAVRTAPPGDSLPLNELGAVYYRAQLYADAANAYAKAARTTPDVEADPLNTADVLSNVANARAAEGDYAGAQRIWQTVFELEPGVPHNWYDRALLRLHVLDFDGARTDAERALELAPDYTAARELLGRLGELARDAALELAPGARADSSVAAASGRARLLERLGRLPDAAGEWFAVVRSKDASADDIETAALHLIAHGPIDMAVQATARWEREAPAAPGLEPAERALGERRETTARLRAVRSLTL